MGTTVKAKMFLIGKKAGFVKRKILSSKENAFPKRGLVVREVVNLVEHFNRVCYWADMEVHVKTVPISLFSSACISAADLIYRLEAVLSITDAVLGSGIGEEIVERKLEIAHQTGQEVIYGEEGEELSSGSD